jgi:mRNA interferase YafQ
VPRRIKTTKQFEKDVRRLKRSGYHNLQELRIAMEIIAKEGVLPVKYEDHPLKGWEGRRDCHIKHDWILIYSLDDEFVTFIRTGTHADLGLD